MKTSTLGATGLQVSRLGFGASPLGNEFATEDPAECTSAVHCAIDLGINLFDVSPYYGRTLAETRLGAALEGKRERVVLATKVGRYGVSDFDFSAGRIFASVDESLTRLRTDYVDLLQAHDIEFGDLHQIIGETIPALREIQRQGKARFIGITGYQLGTLCAAGADIDTVLSYCRYNLLISDLDSELGALSEEHMWGLINASPLHMGLLTDTGPPAWHPAPANVKQAAARAAALCRSRGLSIAEVALQYCLEYPRAASTLTGMATVEHVRANVRAENTSADPALLAAVQAELAAVQNQTWPCGRPENRDYAQTV